MCFGRGWAQCPPIPPSQSCFEKSYFNCYLLLAAFVWDAVEFTLYVYCAIRGITGACVRKKSWQLPMSLREIIWLLRSESYMDIIVLKIFYIVEMCCIAMCEKTVNYCLSFKSLYLRSLWRSYPQPLSELGMPSFGSQNNMCNPLIHYLMINVLFLPDSKRCLFLSSFYSQCLAHN